MAEELVINAPIEERYVDYNGHKTYVKIVGERKDNGKKPLLVLGGQATATCSTSPASPTSTIGRSFSTIRSAAASPWWRTWALHHDLWINEYYTVCEALGLDDFHLFGSSWGGMLGMLCMMKDDKGVNSFVINSSPVLIQSWLSPTT